MGWNAGGFGRMTFPDAAALAAWLESSVSHGDWDDWVGELELTHDQRFVVARQLAAYARVHDPANRGIYAIAIDDLNVDLVFDAGEDDYRASVGDLAATLRAGAPHDAAGTFYFLGTAGAEYEFVYQLDLANRRSIVCALNKKQIAEVYEGPAFASFMERSLAMIEQADPQTQRLMTDLRGKDGKRRRRRSGRALL
jgi:hypothetical protein